MSSPDSMGDPRTGRDRRVPTKARTFKHGTVDPVIQQRRPLLTWGNAILLAVMVAYGMYATGNLPQLDAFFDSLDRKARGRNDLVVHSLIAYGPYLFGFVIFAVFCLFVFLFVNSRRRQLSDPKGWHKVVDRPPGRRHRDRHTEDLPSMVMPIGKERPHRRSSDSPAKAAVTATPAPAAEAITPPDRADAKQTAAPAKATPLPSSPDSLRAAAMLAAAKAEAALGDAPADLPSFVMPLGKVKKAKIQPEPSPLEIAKIAATPGATPLIAAAAAAPAPVAAPDTSTLAAAAAAAKVDAAVAAAKAAAAKAEAAMAAAKAEAAIAEAAMAAANAEAKALNPSS